MQKFVITGAPGTGKTTIINALKARGYNCIDEISREIISNQIAIGGNALPWKDLLAFSERVFTLRESQLLNSDDNLVFFDRGTVDVHAYMKSDHMEIPDLFSSSLEENRYNTKVFYTPIWEDIYVNDKERKESLSQAKEIEKSLLSSYNFFKYQLVKIPKKSIEERVNFILSNI